MRLKLLFFPAALICLMLGIHYAVFKSFMHFFQISRPQVKINLYTAMAVLSFTFITAFIALHWRENLWTVAYYKFAAVWTGFVFHCLAAAAAAWLLLAAARITGAPVSAKAIASTTLAIAILGTGYGMWAAFHPALRHVAVPVQSLPESWKNTTLVHISDLHLGLFHQKAFAARVVNRINSLNPELVLITGDLLDGMGGAYAENVTPLDNLRAAHGVFFVTGNHEHYVGIDKSLAIIGKTPLRILDNEAVKIAGLEILGVSYPGLADPAEIKNLQPQKAPGSLRLAMFHTPTEMAENSTDMQQQHNANYWRPNTGYELNQKLEIDLQLSGHTHHGQVFPVNLLTRMLYKGRDYGLAKINGFYLYTSCGVGSWGPPMRSTGRPEIAVIRLVEKAPE
ncbi:MAG: metallophosphoesterase [Desulfobacterales bacterium]|nr:metallophosphoesterase [Desulfobacterales bacterium]